MPSKRQIGMMSMVIAETARRKKGTTVTRHPTTSALVLVPLLRFRESLCFKSHEALKPEAATVGCC